MFLVIGLIVGIAFGLGAAFTGRRVGTILNIVPIVLWFVVLFVMMQGGLSEPELATLGAAIVGILVGLFVGQVADRRRTVHTKR